MYFKSATIGDSRIQSATPLMHSTKREALEYRESVEKLGLYTLIECVDEQGTIIPP